MLIFVFCILPQEFSLVCFLRSHFYLYLMLFNFSRRFWSVHKGCVLNCVKLLNICENLLSPCFCYGILVLFLKKIQYSWQSTNSISFLHLLFSTVAYNSFSLLIFLWSKADLFLVTESLFNAFATAAFFKFVVFSIFEMRYMLAIWKANRPHMQNGENWEQMRRELSVLYSRFCKYIYLLYTLY